MHGTPPPAPPETVQGDLANLPAALARLKTIPNWVCWKWQERADEKGGGKLTKPPLQPANPQCYANVTDRQTWGTYEQALAAYKAGKCNGIGFCLKGTEFAVFDLDNCRDKQTGTIAPEAMAIVNRAASYTEITPSGTGLRVIGTDIGSNGEVHRKQKINGSAVGVESYSNTARYITVTGLPLRNTEPRLSFIGHVVDAVIAELGNAKLPQSTESFDAWKTANGSRHERDDDCRDIDDRMLPVELKDLINSPLRKRDEDRSEAFHHAVCWLHYDLKWSVYKIEAYIDGKPVMPERYNGRLENEILRCLYNADRKKAEKAKQPANEEAPQGGGRGIALEFFEDFEKTLPKRAIIKGVIYKGERSSWVGPPGSGKSALLADLAIHAAEGTNWRGHRCKEKVAVVYFALERKELVKRRLRAHAKPTIAFEMKDGALATREVQAARTNLPIAVAGKAIDLLDRSCVEIIVDTVCAAETHYGCPVGLIVIDTFNKGIAMGGGDENMAKDQNLVAANLQQIQDVLTDIHVALIGHTGKDESRGARGSNAHLGDVDMMVQISSCDELRTATITKINDGMEGLLTRFTMVTVPLGQDNDGDHVDIGIVADEVPPGSKGIKLSKTQRRALEMLEMLLVVHGCPAPKEAGYFPGVTVLPVEQWRDHCLRSGLSPGAEDKNARRAFNRAMKDLIELRQIGVWDKRVWITPG
jgi:hypothetical protein